ncbi:hypothetical protein DB895_04145 [Flavobacterium psychrotolerans]|uniref:Acyltransferase 3 domain-containing protein n=2 Tax=Flavobacterium psychrotolerans TaxID=2169410 RepID=A0A2U1JLQ3_9FLAO|nr:hypothetical protein DB895_04145 [Flavobacterium psychrotolerans]
MSIQKDYSDNCHTDRIFGLDIFRAIAIILVVKEHGSFLLKNTVLDSLPSIKMIDGVDLFFVLSGYLIGSILLKEINSGEKFGIRELIRFWRRRWLRTLPNYYLILFANYLIIYFGIIQEDIQQFNWKFFFFLQNFSSPFHGFFWESWSLTIEEWFYISVPIFLILFLKFLTPKKSFILVTVLMIVFPFLYRIGIMNYSINDFYLYDITFRKIVMTRLDSIAYGLLASWVYYYFNNYWVKFKTSSFIIGIGLIVFVLNYEAEYNTLYKQVIYFALGPISAMFLLPFAESIKMHKGVFVGIITHVSKISYSMYLLNLALIAEVVRDNFAPTNEIDGIVKYLLFWFFVLVGSSVLYKYYEKPILNFRDR